MIKRPMKGAAVEDLEVVRFPCITMPKIDGFRCVLADRAHTSRLASFPNHSFMRQTKGVLPRRGILDSEAVCGLHYGPGVLQRTSSGLTSEQGDPDWYLHAFDTFEPGVPYAERLEHVTLLARLSNNDRIRPLEYRWIYNYKELEEYITECLERGFEGIITRDPLGHYKEGKSTLKQQGMLKVKPFEDFEARITGYYEEMENTNEAKREKTGKLKRSSSKAGKKPKGTLGGFIGKTLKGGVEVRVGGGFTAKQRREFWLRKDELVEAGAVMKCKKQKVGEKDKPRHPNFLSLRPEWDLAE